MIAAAAKDAGIEVRDIPFTAGSMSDENVEDFRKALDELPHPVLAYCRSGSRSSLIYEAAQKRKK